MVQGIRPMGCGDDSMAVACAAAMNLMCEILLPGEKNCEAGVWLMARGLHAHRVADVCAASQRVAERKKKCCFQKCASKWLRAWCVYIGVGGGWQRRVGGG